MKTWHYGPSITTRMGGVPAKDHIKLPAYSRLNETAPTAAEGAFFGPYLLIQRSGQMRLCLHG
jgi:hypothetical protein